MKKGKLFKSVNIMLIVLLVFSVLSGCGKNEKDAKKDESKTETGKGEITFPLEEQITVSVMTPDFSRDRERKIDKEVEKRLNMKFEWSLIPMSDYDQKLKLTLASGDLPDLILLKDGKNILDKFSPQGLFLDLMQHIDQMPNYKKWAEKFPELLTAVTTQEGKMYGMQNFNTMGKLPVGYLYNTDVFEKHNLKLPKTFDEMYNSLKTLKGIYPDSTPISVRWGAGNLTYYFYKAYHTGDNVYFNSDEMKYKFGPLEENFKRAITTMRKFYEADLIDPEFATLSDAQWYERINNDKVFALIGEYMVITGQKGEIYQTTGKGNNFKAELPPMTENGLQAKVFPQYATSQAWIKAINAQTKYADILVKYLDWTVSEEAIELVNWGIEGETFEYGDDNLRYFTDDIQTAKNPKGTVKLIDLGLDGRSGFWCPLDVELKFRVTWDELAYQNEKLYLDNRDEIAGWQPMPVQLSQNEKDEMSRVNNPIKTYVEESVLKFITGVYDMDGDWDKFQEKLSTMNYERMEEMYNNAYDAMPETDKKLRKF